MIADSFGQLQELENQGSAQASNDYFRQQAEAQQAQQFAAQQAQQQYVNAFQAQQAQNQAQVQQQQLGLQRDANYFQGETADALANSRYDQADTAAQNLALEQEKQKWIEDQTGSKVDNIGQTYAKSFGDTFGAYNDAFDGKSEALKDYSDLQKQAQQDPSLTPIPVKAGSNIIRSVIAKDPNDPKAVAAAAQLNGQLTDTLTEVQNANAGFLQANKTYQNKVGELQRAGFDVDYDNGEIVHAPTQKRFDYFGSSGSDSDSDETPATTPSDSSYFDATPASPSAPSTVSPATMPGNTQAKFQVGHVYADAAGRKQIYNGGDPTSAGSWTTISFSQQPSYFGMPAGQFM